MQTTVNSIKDLFMGNPGALQQKIQTEQKAKPGIPPDLRELLALQEIQDQHQAMQRQQALQNPANQPTIADKLKQTLATQQQQMAQAGLPGAQGMPPQPERQPEMGVDQLPANLGQHYDGGGIVAFNGEEDSFVGDPMLGTMVARNELGGDDRTLFERLGVFNPENRRALEAMERRIAESKAGKKEETPAAQAPATSTAQAPTPKPPAQRPPGLPGSPRVQPTVEQAPVAPVAPVAQEPQDPLAAAMEKKILENLNVDRDAKGLARRTEAEKYLGLDSLLGAQRERAQKEYDMQKQQAQGRNAFSAFAAGINPNARTLAEGLRGGQQTLAAATAGWDKSDLEALQNFNKAMTGIDTQTVAGKKFAWDAENDFLKDLSAEARNSITSGTSLVNTRENAAARKQSAKDAADARVEAAKEGRLGRESAARIAKERNAIDVADRQDARYREQAMKLAVAAATKEKSLPQNITKLKNVSIEELAATMFNNYYEMLKSGKMPEAPGAASPGGNTKLRFDAQGNPIK